MNLARSLASLQNVHRIFMRNVGLFFQHFKSFFHCENILRQSKKLYRQQFLKLELQEMETKKSFKKVCHSSVSRILKTGGHELQKI